ncbi:hypothetical protein [Plantactinospora sonchi]|uniref:Uncharacterized protein n=1 Tax=Plantactinospora sonchi TaxID=1544735 RepID=A0ABU7RRM0_9ACTN
MTNRATQLALVAGASYLVGRRRRLRLALLLGSAVAAGRFSGDWPGLVRRGAKAVGGAADWNPVRDLGGPLVKATRAAASSAVTRHVESVSNDLRQRADRLRTPRPAEPDENRQDEGSGEEADRNTRGRNAGGQSRSDRSTRGRNAGGQSRSDRNTRGRNEPAVDGRDRNEPAVDGRDRNEPEADDWDEAEDDYDDQDVSPDDEVQDREDLDDDEADDGEVDDDADTDDGDLDDDDEADDGDTDDEPVAGRSGRAGPSQRPTRRQPPAKAAPVRRRGTR